MSYPVGGPVSTPGSRPSAWRPTPSSHSYVGTQHNDPSVRDEETWRCITSNGPTEGTQGNGTNRRPLTSRGPCRILQDAADVGHEEFSFSIGETRWDNELHCVRRLQLLADPSNVALVGVRTHPAPGLIPSIRMGEELLYWERPLTPPTGLLTIHDSTHTDHPSNQNSGNLTVTIICENAGPTQRDPDRRSCRVPRVHYIISS